MKELDPRWMDTKFRQEMGFHHLRIGVLVQEVELQCKFILMADAQLRCAGSSDEAWYAIQALLVAAANVSKSAWAGGSRMTPKEIALSRQLTAELRKALDLDGSPFESRAIRNDFEHFDHRFITWLLKSKFLNYIGRFIGQFRDSRGNVAISGIGFKQSEVFFHYDPNGGAVTFLKHSTSIPVLVDEARRVQAVAYEWIRKPIWEVLEP